MLPDRNSSDFLHKNTSRYSDCWETWSVIFNFTNWTWKLRKPWRQKKKTHQRTMALNTGIYAAVIFVVFSSAFLFAPAEGGCWEKQLCCPGKNVTCKADGRRMNDVHTGKHSRVCFCDEYCLGLKDCCSDYHDTCKRKYRRWYLFSFFSQSLHKHFLKYTRTIFTRVNFFVQHTSKKNNGTDKE